MKKVVATLVLVFAVAFTTQAQRGKKGDFEKLSVAQKTDLAVKKMTLRLDLSPAQQNQIRPLLAEQMTKRAAKHAEFKKMKESGKKREKISAEERYKKQSERLDEMIAFKTDMKRILTPEQFAKFEKGAKRKMGKRKHKMKKRRGKKERHFHDEER